MIFCFQQFSDFLDIPYLFDVIKSYYWETPEPNSIGEKPCIHPRTKQILGQRPNAEDRQTVRQYILQIMETLLRYSKEHVYHIL